MTCYLGGVWRGFSLGTGLHGRMEAKDQEKDSEDKMGGTWLLNYGADHKTEV